MQYTTIQDDLYNLARKYLNDRKSKLLAAQIFDYYTNIWKGEVLSRITQMTEEELKDVIESLGYVKKGE